MNEDMNIDYVTPKREWKYVWANLMRFVKGEALIHCWNDGHDEFYRSYSCMRANGHFGKCEFYRDFEIGVQFSEPS